MDIMEDNPFNILFQTRDLLRSQRATEGYYCANGHHKGQKIVLRQQRKEFYDKILYLLLLMTNFISELTKYCRQIIPKQEVKEPFGHKNEKLHL